MDLDAIERQLDCLSDKTTVDSFCAVVEELRAAREVLDSIERWGSMYLLDSAALARYRAVRGDDDGT